MEERTKRIYKEQKTRNINNRLYKNLLPGIIFWISCFTIFIILGIYKYIKEDKNEKFSLICYIIFLSCLGYIPSIMFFRDGRNEEKNIIKNRVLV